MSVECATAGLWIAKVDCRPTCGHPARLRIRGYFKGAELAQMSSGTYCIIRPLGRVKGGKGLRHHENLLTLTLGGITSKLTGGLGRLVSRLQRESLADVDDIPLSHSLEGKQPVAVRAK